MYNTRRETRKFNTDRAEDLREYDKILNNPLCTIINERKEKLNLTTFSEEGRPESSEDNVVLVVTWEEKFLP